MWQELLCLPRSNSHAASSALHHLSEWRFVNSLAPCCCIGASREIELRICSHGQPKLSVGRPAHIQGERSKTTALGR